MNDPVRAISAFIGNRLNEWVMVTCLFGLSLQLMLTPMSPTSSLRLLLQVASPGGIGLSYLFLSLSRAVALIINGRSLVYGPHARALGALAGAVIWGQMEVSLVKLYLGGVTTNSPGISLYFAMILGEIVTVYRASTDVRRHRT